MMHINQLYADVYAGIICKREAISENTNTHMMCGNKKEMSGTVPSVPEGKTQTKQNWNEKAVQMKENVITIKWINY